MTASIERDAPIALKAGQEPWMRQDAESDEAYMVFTMYRDLGLTRSLSKLQDLKVNDERPNASIPRGTLDFWSRRFRWRERVTAWDASIEEEYRAEMVKMRREAAKTQVAISRQFMNKIIQRMGTIDISTMTIPQMAQWFETAAKVERQALGMPTEVHEHTGPGGGPIRHQVVDPDPALAEAAHDFLYKLAEVNRGRGIGPPAEADEGEIVDAEIIDGEADDDEFLPEALGLPIGDGDAAED